MAQLLCSEEIDVLLNCDEGLEAKRISDILNKKSQSIIEEMCDPKSKLTKIKSLNILLTGDLFTTPEYVGIVSNLLEILESKVEKSDMISEYSYNSEISKNDILKEIRSLKSSLCTTYTKMMDLTH